MRAKVCNTEVLLITSAFFILFFAGATPAMARSYYYESIEQTIKVNQNTTFDVEEKQLYNFSGQYNKGWRSIPLKGIDYISDILVIDGRTGIPLAYSSKQLDKTSPLSWGKYTSYYENGSQIIEWYYNVSDQIYPWVLKYKVHGGLAFNQRTDRLYWNLFTNYDVSVASSVARVILPPGVEVGQTTFNSYRSFTDPSGINKYQDQQNHFFVSSGYNFLPNEAFTIDIEWPKGFVNRTEYWKDFLGANYGLIFFVLTALFSLIAGLIYWLMYDKWPTGKGIIVAEYEPPQNIRPAIAEVIMKEKITPKGYTATIVDLAVRGYLKIEEDEVFGKAEKAIKIISVLVLETISFFFVTSLSYAVFITGYVSQRFFTLVLLSVWASVFYFVAKKIYAQRDYKVIQIKDNIADDQSLLPYEKKLVEIIMQGSTYFSTRENRHNSILAQAIATQLNDFKDDIYKEIEDETRAYVVGPSMEKWKNVIFIIILAIMGLSLFFYSTTHGLRSSQPLFIVLSLLFYVGLLAFTKFEARLSKQGTALRGKISGFKEYLNVAERYRMQNLPPEYFEKYLPYAIVFGVEKKWARAFGEMQMAPPQWYIGTNVGGNGIGNFGASSGSFSASAFSASFSSSFSSAFASGTGGGGGGGGGGAGGGGGGGGGGAS